MDDCRIAVSVEHCKSLLITIARMLCVRADLISTRLLSTEDKNDMLNGLLPEEVLFLAVKCWIAAGMPDYANGKSALNTDWVPKAG
jgi:hypothetical protein